MYLQIAATTDGMKKVYNVYRIDALFEDTDKWQLIYIGAGHVRDIIKFKHTPYVSNLIAVARQIVVTTISAHVDATSAGLAQVEEVKKHKSPGNNPDNFDVDRSRAAAMIRRSDGVIFGSIREAAQAINAPASSISNHLANRYGYKTVRGFTFTREG